MNTYFMDDIDKDIIDAFLNIETKRDLADVLKIPYKNLMYNLYKIPKEDKYKVFEITKRNGGIREIYAPISRIKNIQKKLSNILNNVHPLKFCVHGYAKNKSIKTNAQIHVKKRIVINLDLKDFFPSINFGRVRGLFKSYPFNFNDEIATVLAQICCHEGFLPQGAPSSPVISNYICHRLDNQIIELAKSHKVDYTRYADDLTFSTNLKELPKEIGRIENNILILSSNLLNIIESNGFKVNDEKTRFAFRNNRQEVTGLVVNTQVNINRKYIRHVRAMLHAWEKFGIEDAAKEHFEKYNYKNKLETDLYSFVKEILGKIGYIGYIKGKNSNVYKNIYKRIKSLDSEINLAMPEEVAYNPNEPLIFCEGKTDRLHLVSALEYFKNKGEFLSLNIGIFKYEEDTKITNSRLLQACETRPELKRNKRIEIYLFDRDVKSFNEKVAQKPKLYKYWNNNVFSALLPVPKHREFDEICIEHYYTDEEIKIKDNNDRRLFLSYEFDINTGKHKEEELSYPNISYLKAPYPRIIDYNVFKFNGKNVALSKKAFGENILNKKGDFLNVSFENFRPIFELFDEIIKYSKSIR